MNVAQRDGYAAISVDATKDPYNVWYAISKRSIAPFVNLNRLKGPNTELRVEAIVNLNDIVIVLILGQLVHARFYIYGQES